MVRFKDLLGSRFTKKEEKPKKVSELAERSHTGQLSGFSGVFQIGEATEVERDAIIALLDEYKSDSVDIVDDTRRLLTLTSEIRAINNQAILLHGARIKKAQQLLKSYKEGAFTKWLVTAYGNRQTPYNFLQYFELYNGLDSSLKEIANDMPKQVLYSLSSRPIPPQKKEEFIKKFKGESKTELLKKLRDQFPTKPSDKRKPQKVAQIQKLLQEAQSLSRSKDFAPTHQEKEQIMGSLQAIEAALSNSQKW